jgi:hypothetical protein
VNAEATAAIEPDSTKPQVVRTNSRADGGAPDESRAASTVSPTRIASTKRSIGARSALACLMASR